ncbi:hypothetical protein ACQJBY_014729 [Aegilops geniculata]
MHLFYPISSRTSRANQNLIFQTPNFMALPPCFLQVQETLVKRLYVQVPEDHHVRFPGPTIEVYNGDTLAIKAVNLAQYNVNLHWHGLRQLRNGWADGPEFVTQRNAVPHPPRPGSPSRTRSSWLRATVHGAQIIHPRRRRGLPKPHTEFPVNLAEWWRRDPIAVLRQSMITQRLRCPPHQRPA